jgi:hypothetical protein
MMKPLLLAVALGTLALASLPALAADTVPCEDMLKNVRTAEAAAKLGDADKTKVTELENKGIERCNADDDKRANDFFAQAMKIMGK